MTKLIVVQSGREKSFDLIDDVVFVGSSADCAIRLQDKGVDERHCQVLKVDGCYRVLNLGGSGTRVNGQPITQQGLTNGDVIQVGAVEMTFRGGLVPEQVEQESQPAAGPPSSATKRGPRSGSGGGRRPRRPKPRGVRGRSSGREVRVGSRMHQAASQREVLVRQRVRKSGLSGPATIAIATAISLVVIVFGYFMFRGFESGEYGEAYSQAMVLVGKSQYDKARLLLESIPPEASVYRHAREQLEKMEQRETVGALLENIQKGESEFQNNIKEFIRTKIETENEDYKGDLAYVRVVVKRLENFLVEFEGNKHCPAVSSLLAHFKPMVPTTPMTWHDIFVDADVERARGKYGPAYKAVTEWIVGHPEGDEYELKQAGKMREKIVRGANFWWKNQDARALDNIRKGNVNAAHSGYLTASRRLKGMPELYGKARAKATRLEEQVGEMIVK